MGNFLTKPAKWRLLSKKEIDDDWATKSNWICNDQLCPNPYTHARESHDGRPFPLPPGASDLRGHEAAKGRIRRLADRVGQREQGQEQLMFSRKLSIPKTNKNI
jgi:hypothetical protein